MSYGSRGLKRRRDHERKVAARKRAEAAPVVVNPVRIVERHEAASQSFPVIRDPNTRRLVTDGSGNYHVDRWLSVERLREISRLLDHGTSTYSQMLTRWLAHLVGEGPVYVPNSSDTEWNTKAAKVIANDVALKRYDAKGEHEFADWLSIYARGIARDGANATLPQKDGSAYLIDAMRLLDVQTDENGREVSWSVAPFSESGVLDRANAVRVRAQDINVSRIRVYDDQHFGVPILFASLQDHDGIGALWDGETQASVQSTGPWLTIGAKPTSGGMPSTINPGDAAAGMGTNAVNPHLEGRTTPPGWIHTAAGAYVMAVPDGLEAEGWMPNRPNLDVPEFSKQRIAICCNVLAPYPLLFDDSSKLTFSNLRGIQRTANSLLTRFRAMYLNDMLAAFARRRLAIAIAAGVLDPVEDWQLGAWKWPEVDIQDRNREAQANTLDLANGVENLEVINGPNWRSKMQQRAAEWREAAELTRQHNEEFPDQPITIHHVGGNPAGLSNALAASAAADQAIESNDQSARSEAGATGDTYRIVHTDAGTTVERLT